MGGVFINYRVVDNPLGAAGIHDALVRKFGKENVFRDSVSLEAGEDYPAAIWHALAKSEVLVSIVGPQWLSLRDPDGVRLIDRERDWVRRELVMARERGITILPVFLRDVPAHAPLITADMLPADIAWFAHIQMFTFSQLTFGVDLERLAARLTELAPSLRTNGHARPLSFSTDLVSALEVLPCMEDEQSRAQVVRMLRPAIASAVNYFSRRRAHVMSILQTCRNYEDGMAELVEVITTLEPEGSLALRNFLKVLNDIEG
jgi:hypothetical protein